MTSTGTPRNERMTGWLRREAEAAGCVGDVGGADVLRVADDQAEQPWPVGRGADGAPRASGVIPVVMNRSMRPARVGDAERRVGSRR